MTIHVDEEMRRILEKLKKSTKGFGYGKKIDWGQYILVYFKGL